MENDNLLLLLGIPIPLPRVKHGEVVNILDVTLSNPVETQKRSPRKCSASRASACASVMGGISGLRGRAPNPTKYRLAYWRRIRSGVVSVAG